MGIESIIKSIFTFNDQVSFFNLRDKLNYSHHEQMFNFSELRLSNAKAINIHKKYIISFKKNLIRGYDHVHHFANVK